MFESLSLDPARLRMGMPSGVAAAIVGESVPSASPAPTIDRWRPPAEMLLEHLEDADSAVGRAADAAGDSAHHLSTSQLASALTRVDQVHASTEALTVALVAEGLDRGLHSDSGLSPRDWVGQRCPWLSPHDVGDIVTVAHAANDHNHAPVVNAVSAMRLSVRRAAAVLRSLGRVKPILKDPDYDKAMTLLIDTAVQSRFTDRDLTRASDFLISVVLPDKDHEAQVQAGRDLRGVNESSLADGTYVRFIVTCDVEGAAVFRAILASPLAAPHPNHRDSHDSHDSSEFVIDPPGRRVADKDTRTATQRKFDALITVLRRGLTGGEHTPTSPKATVNVTISWDTIRRQLTGTGTTVTGEVLSPETVRRIACDADLVPIVLGTDNEILAMGRTRRLVTAGQRRALEHRDQHCSFPGCSTPAPWCDAHHVIHWSRGGLSDISNYALLCGRHHTIAHERDLTATVATTGVRWHL